MFKILPLLASNSWQIWRRQWHPTPVLLPGKSHGWRSLEGCSPWSCWGLDTTEWLHFHFSLSCIGEGNGNPLQCSCLENPRDGGAWWAAIYGVAQSRTRLKWLSSSNWQIWCSLILKYFLLLQRHPHLASCLWAVTAYILWCGHFFSLRSPAISTCCESLSSSYLVLNLHLGSYISYCILDGWVDLGRSSLAVSSVFQGIWISCASPACCLDCWGGLHFLERSPHLASAYLGKGFI